jgi:hypothetical protein
MTAMRPLFDQPAARPWASTRFARESKALNRVTPANAARRERELSRFSGRRGAPERSEHLERHLPHVSADIQQVAIGAEMLDEGVHGLAQQRETPADHPLVGSLFEHGHDAAGAPFESEYGAVVRAAEDLERSTDPEVEESLPHGSVEEVRLGRLALFRGGLQSQSEVKPRRRLEPELAREPTKREAEAPPPAKVDQPFPRRVCNPLLAEVVGKDLAFAGGGCVNFLAHFGLTQDRSQPLGRIGVESV